MTGPHDLHELHDLLDLATDRVESTGLAPAALAAAHRRRRTRRAVVASAAVAVVIAGAALAGRIGGAPSSEPEPAPSPSTAIAPEIAADRIQPVWDPRGAEGQPVVELGVPRVMESLVPGAVTRPVAVLDDGSRTLLVSADGAYADLALPEGLGAQRTVSLSPDGSRLAAVGLSGFFWRSLDGEWQRVILDEEDRVTGEGITVTWAADSSSIVLRGSGYVQVDLDTGEQRVLAGVREPVPDALLGPLENLQRPIVGYSSIAAARANVSWPEVRQADDYDGLIALDRGTLETRGFLRVPDQSGYYVDGGVLTPVTWLDGDTVAFTVLPKDAPKEYLMTWDVETGEVSRVSCWSRSYDAVFATGLLG